MLPAGTQLAGYRIEGVLGRGGMGTVYAARQLSLDRPVALKVLEGEPAGGAAGERFRREAELQAALDHPSVVTVYEAGAAPEGLFIAMQLIHGTTLREVIGGGLEPERALELLAPVADALDTAHAAGLIHRDVKPRNVLVDGDGRAHLADFGLVKGAGPSLTEAGGFVGTADYAAPEQVRGERATTATDVYALAAVLYECLAGAVVFPRQDLVAALHAHAHEDPPPVSGRRAGVPASLDAPLAQGLAKDPAERPRSAGALIAAVRDALDPARTIPPAPAPKRVLPSAVTRARAGGPLVGRDAELAALAEAWAASGPDAPVGLVLVQGEPGAGKTRLAAEHAARLHDTGARVLFGRCDADVPAPFRPWLAVLGDLVAAADHAAVARHVDAHGGVLARLLGPAARERLAPGRAPEASDDDDGERHRLLAAAAGLVTAAAARDPLVIVLDDVHAADPASLQLLRTLLQGPDAHVLVVATARDAEADVGPALRDALPALSREAGTRRLPLGRLDRAATGALVAAAGHPRLAEDLYEDTAGNPLFLVEVLRHLAEHGEEGRRDVPGSVTEMIARRVEGLGPDAARAARYAAALGRTFDLGLLAHVLDEDEEAVLDALETCCRAAVVTEVGEPPGRFQFSHPLVTSTLAAQLTDARRRRVHRRAAEALAAAGSRDAVTAGTLALHWASAGEPFLEQAVAAAVDAADHALSVLALDDAVRALARAKELHDRLEAPDPDQETELLLRLGDAERRAGHENYEDHLLQAAERARARGDAERLVRAALANSRGLPADFRMTDERRIAILEAALEAVDDGAVRERALLVAALASEHFADRERRLALADEALVLARAAGDDRALADVLYRRALTIAEPGTVGERLHLTAELTRLGARLGDPLVQLRAAAERARALFEAGRADAVDEARRVVELAPGTGSAFAGFVAANMRSLLLAREGRLDEAEAEALRGAEESAGVVPDAAAILGAQLLPIRWDQGRLGELADWAVAAAAAPGAQLGYRALVPLALHEAGRDDEARAALDAGLADGLPLEENVLYLVGAALWAEAGLRLEHREVAALSLERLLPWREQYVFSGVSLLGSVARLCAGLSALLGRDAGSLFALAETVDERVGAPGPLARTLVDHGRWLAAAGDAEAAATRLGRARALAERHGFARLAAAAGAIVPAAAEGSPSPAPLPGALVREGDVWTLEVDGRVTRLRDGKGVRYLAQLLGAPGVERHALDLVGARAPDGDGAGPALDDAAKAAYRARVEELRDEIEEAERFNDPERLATARQELDWLARSLSQAVGLGGRDRPQAAAAERARVNVTRAIRGVLRRVAEHDERTARMLEADVRTGTFCVYAPDPGRPVRWRLDAG